MSLTHVENTFNDPFTRYMAEGTAALKRTGMYDTWFGSPTDTTIGNVFSYATSLMQNDFNREMYDKYLREIDPSTQLHKLLAAGLNPAAAYQALGNGSPSSPQEKIAPSLSGGSRADKRAEAQLVMDAVNQFAGSMMQLADTGTSLYQKIHYNMPISREQLWREKELNTGLRSLSIATEKNWDDWFSSDVEWRNDPQYQFLGYNGNGEKVYAFNPGNNALVASYLNDIGATYRNSAQEKYMQDYRQHMREMFPSEETYKEAQAAIQKYLQNFEQTLPKSLRFMAPILLSMMRMFR